jgi:hypothetical protein
MLLILLQSITRDCYIITNGLLPVTKGYYWHYYNPLQVIVIYYYKWFVTGSKRYCSTITTHYRWFVTSNKVLPVIKDVNDDYYKPL